MIIKSEHIRLMKKYESNMSNKWQENKNEQKELKKKNKFI